MKVLGSPVGKKTTRVLITPDMANQWLEDSEIGWGLIQQQLGPSRENRKIKRLQLALMIRKAKEGTFPADLCVPIRISAEKAILDGQHRINMIRDSLVPMYFDVEFNAPYSDMQDYDGGVSRTTADALKVRGTNHPKERTALTNQILRQTLNKNIKVSIEDVDWMSTDSPFSPGFNFALQQYINSDPQSHRVNIAPVWGALIVVYSCFDLDTLTSFAHKIMTGANLSVGDPALALRNALVQKEGSGSSANEDKYRRVYSALRAVYLGNTLRTSPQVGPSAQQFFHKLVKEDIDTLRIRYRMFLGWD